MTTWSTNHSLSLPCYTIKQLMSTDATNLLTGKLLPNKNQNVQVLFDEYKGQISIHVENKYYLRLKSCHLRWKHSYLFSMLEYQGNIYYFFSTTIVFFITYPTIPITILIIDDGHFSLKPRITQSVMDFNICDDKT